MTSNSDIASKARLYVHADIPIEAWDSFVSDCDQSLVFHRSEWLGVLEKTLSAPLRRYGLFSDRECNDLIGVMPVFVGRFGPFHVGGSPLVLEDTPYMGPAIAEEWAVPALTAVREQVKREASFFRTVLPYRLSSAACDALASTGFMVITKKTHRLDLSPDVSILWKAMEGRCRTAVRRARKSGVTVRRVRDPNSHQLRDYFALVEEVFGRQGRRPPNPFSFFEGLWQAISLRDGLSMVLAELEGKVIAGAIFAHDRHRIYYIDGASAHEYRKLNASNLLLWDAIEWGAEEGRREFDFVGSDIPRLARFKASFGGREVEHSCIEWGRSRAAWLARNWWGRYGHVWFARLRHLRNLPLS